MYSFIENGQLWTPKSHSLIRSNHFVGNQKSKDPRSPSYIPCFLKFIKKKNV